MVAPIRYFGADPDKVGRGAGHYYNRYGNKGKFSHRYGKRLYYARYSKMRDYNRKARTKIRTGNPEYPHIGDGTYWGKTHFVHSLNMLHKKV